MIQLNQVSKAYGTQVVLEGVSLCINRGERCALVGRNGTGKTTLLRLIAGEEECDSGDIMTPKGYRIGTLKQHLAVSKSTVIEEACLGLPDDRPDLTYQAEAILFGLGFTKEDMQKHPDTFSGGYRIRMHLCKLLVSDPDCLLLDEPSNYLDILSLRWLVRFLQGWKGEVIVISHDREFLDSVSTHTIGIHRHRIKKVAEKTEGYFSQILQEEEIHEKTRVNLEKKRAHMQSFVDRFGAKASKATQAQSRAKAIEKLPALERLASLHDLDFSFRYSSFNSQKVVAAQDISFAYTSTSPQIIRSFDFLLENQEKIAIIGKNGKGKSTLLQLLGQFLQPQDGTVKIADNAKIGYFGQTHIDRLNSSKTIYEEVASANPTLSYTEVRAICGTMMFSGATADKRISVLSGGEKSRVLLGKILATPCNLLLLDEPTNHLDMESVEVLVRAIEDFPGAVILVTHCEWILHRLPSKLIVCHQDSQKVFDGSYGDFLRKLGWEEEDSDNKNKHDVDTNDKNTNPKDLRQQKAMERQEKQQLLQPLQKKMEQLEKKITETEMRITEYVNKLAEASEKKQSALIVQLSKDIDQLNKFLGDYYRQYEEVSVQYENAKT